MEFTNEEIEKAKELKKRRLNQKPAVGSFLHGRTCPKGCVLISENIFLIHMIDEEQKDLLWLPTMDELLLICRDLKISFSQITDYLHRRRFADGREREGVYQLLIEHLR